MLRTLFFCTGNFCLFSVFLSRNTHTSCYATSFLFLAILYFTVLIEFIWFYFFATRREYFSISFLPHSINTNRYCRAKGHFIILNGQHSTREDSKRKFNFFLCFQNIIFTVLAAAASEKNLPILRNFNSYHMCLVCSTFTTYIIHIYYALFCLNSCVIREFYSIPLYLFFFSTIA